MSHNLSIIVPMLNEADNINSFLSKLQHLRHSGHELILVDGGSTDNTIALAKPYCDKILHSTPSRAIQMNTGAAAANGETLLFLHADTLLPDTILTIINTQMQSQTDFWGRFDLQFDNKKWIYRLIATMMNRRSRLTGIATGDQAIFINRLFFKSVSGFPEITLMEDIQLCSILKKYSQPCCIVDKVTTSARRWEKNGVYRTIIQMWWLRLLFFLGVSPDKLHSRYYPKAKKI